MRLTRPRHVAHSPDLAIRVLKESQGGGEYLIRFGGGCNILRCLPDMRWRVISMLVRRPTAADRRQSSAAPIGIEARGRFSSSSTSLAARSR